MALTESELKELQSLEAQEGLTPSVGEGNLGKMQAGDARVEQLIKSRGTESFGQATERFVNAQGGFAKTMAGLNLAAMPFERYEAGIANAAMDLQDVKGFDVAWQGFLDGVKGKRLGEIGDVYRKAGTPEYASATIGLVTSMLPIASQVLKGVAKVTKLTKFTDKGLKLAGAKLVDASETAGKFVGQLVDKVYEPINKMNIDQWDAIKLADDLPPALVKHIEKTIGKGIESINTIGDMRIVKSTIGKFRPTAFGKKELGAVETIEGMNINKAYAMSKNVIQETLERMGLGDHAKKILAADEAATEVYRASDFIKKAVMDKTLQIPTRGGKVASAMSKGGDLSTRTALKTLLEKGGKDSAKSINQAVKFLNEYNKIVAISSTGQKILNYAVLGGFAGSIGAKSANNAFDGGGE